jgi:DNA-binding transcriptional LysR family regulator
MIAIDDPQPYAAPPWSVVIPLRERDETVRASSGRQTSVSAPRSQAKRPMRITLEQLRIFSAVAEREHLTAAAQALRLSQGSVSVQVRRLEKALGLPLLHRVGRNVRLTDVGRAVHRQALEALRSAQSVEDLATSYLQEDRGEVVVAAGLVIGAHRVSGWIGPFVHAHPLIDVHISIAPLQAAMESLITGVADIVLVGAAVPTANVETVTLERTELVIVVASQHPLATHASPLDDLSKHRHLAHEHGSATQLHAGGVLHHLADLSPTTELEEGALLAALHTGLGFAVMPRSTVEAEIAAGSLTVLEGPGGPVPVAFTAVRRIGPHTPAVDAFWRHLQSLAPA